jgi:hypothetical protein
MWEDTVELDRPQVTIWRKLIACWITKATNAHPEYITYCFSNATIIARMRLNVALYVRSTFLLYLILLAFSP